MVFTLCPFYNLRLPIIAIHDFVMDTCPVGLEPTSTVLETAMLLCTKGIKNGLMIGLILALYNRPPYQLVQI